MTPREREAYFIVMKGGIRTQVDLAKRMGVSKARASVLLNSLRDMGFLEHLPAVWRVKK